MSDGKENKEISLREKEEIQKDSGEPTKEGIYFSPTVDIYETDDAITLLADLPGVEKGNLDINVEDRQLTITGSVNDPEKGLQSIYTEYGIGGYTRSFKLGDAIDPSKINAALKDGVLTLVLPKAEALKPRKIEITTS
ncbi:MAG: Hsp20/alpha crystallin family protein [Myxococcota bacterium]|nr:Hsp20/alpha crystallin family protein [Myxococcota bacterium]